MSDPGSIRDTGVGVVLPIILILMCCCLGKKYIAVVFIYCRDVQLSVLCNRTNLPNMFKLNSELKQNTC